MGEIIDNPVFKAFQAWGAGLQFDNRFLRFEDGEFERFIDANTQVAWLAFRDGWKSCAAHDTAPETDFLKGATI